VFAQDGTAVFQATFQGIKETTSFHRGCPFRELSFFGRQAPRRLGGPATGKAAKALTGAAATDSYQATFVWRIEHFTRLKDLLKKRKITGLCVKSKRFLVGGCTCRLIVYPRGGLQGLNAVPASLWLRFTDHQYHHVVLCIHVTTCVWRPCVQRMGSHSNCMMLYSSRMISQYLWIVHCVGHAAALGIEQCPYGSLPKSRCSACML
jgi:hypothetical protein